MPDTSARQRRSDCPVNVSLEIFGDRWTLLIVRDLMLLGRSTYGDFLGGGEGIASNVLADRLSRLELHQIVTRRADPTDARRQIYRLTEKGISLAPMLTDMMIWAARHEKTAASEEEIAFMENHREQHLAEIKERWRQAGAS